MAIKVLTQVISTAANSSSLAAVATQDDNLQRTLTGIWVSDHTTGLQAEVQLTGKTVVQVDDTVMNLLKDFLEVEVVFPPGIQFFLGFNNTTGGAINNVAFIYRYEV